MRTRYAAFSGDRRRRSWLIHSVRITRADGLWPALRPNRTTPLATGIAAFGEDWVDRARPSKFNLPLPNRSRFSNSGYSRLAAQPWILAGLNPTFGHRCRTWDPAGRLGDLDVAVVRELSVAQLSAIAQQSAKLPVLGWLSPATTQSYRDDDRDAGDIAAGLFQAGRHSGVASATNRTFIPLSPRLGRARDRRGLPRGRPSTYHA